MLTAESQLSWVFVAVLYSVVWYTQTVLDSELQIMLEKEHERERLMGTYVLSICGAFTKLLLGFYALTITICRFVKLLFLCILAPRCLSSMDCATVGEHSLSLSYLSPFMWWWIVAGVPGLMGSVCFWGPPFC